MPTEAGYYWIRFLENQEWIIGYYDGSDFLPVQIVVSDSIYEEVLFEWGDKILRK